MEEGTINKTAKIIYPDRIKNIPEDKTEKVQPVSEAEKKEVDESTKKKEGSRAPDFLGYDEKGRKKFAEKIGDNADIKA